MIPPQLWERAPEHLDLTQPCPTEGTSAGAATSSRDKEASELWFCRRRRRRRDDLHHHSPKAELSRGGASALSQVPHSEASNCRERGAGRQKKGVWERGESKEKRAAPGEGREREGEGREGEGRERKGKR